MRRLTDQDYRDIYLSPDSRAALAERYGVSRAYVSAIWQRIKALSVTADLPTRSKAHRTKMWTW